MIKFTFGAILVLVAAASWIVAIFGQQTAHNETAKEGGSQKWTHPRENFHF
jgi:hypothetical protein